MESAQSRLQSETPESDNTGGPRRIAIIGSGIAGSSAAYRLHDEYGSLIAFDITVYEASAQVGGRINSTFVDNKANGYAGFVEIGARTFSIDDLCIQVAIDEAGLRRKIESSPFPKTSVGVWNGNEWILRREQDLKSRTWKDFARDTWKYGTSPRNLQRLIEDKLPQYRQLYGDFDYVNPNLPDMIRRRGLIVESEQSAEDYLLGNGISSSYLNDIIQPTVRASCAHDLNDLNGLSALVAMNPARTYQINSNSKGFNEFPYRLLRLSEAHVHLNSRVTQIDRSSRGKYTITTSPSTTSAEGGDEYDAVIIATHLEGSGIELPFPVPQLNSLLPPFVGRHVTTFTSAIDTTLSPQYFNVASAAEIPDLIFTTRESTSQIESQIFSIEHSLVGRGLDGDVMMMENLYRITSAEPISDSTIAELVGQAANTSLDTFGILWVNRQAWPLASPNITRGPRLNNVEIADSLFYTGIGEELVSSMEMSCRMGRLVTHLIFRDFYSRSEGSENIAF